MVLVVTLLLLSSSILLAKTNIKPADTADSYPVHNVNTGLNYTTIQSAIDANETLDGHTIFVEQGKYYEHLIVNKSLSLIGEDISTTIIDGNFTGIPVTIAASHVNITDFTVQEAWFGTWYVFDGYTIYLTPGTSHSNINHNIIANNLLVGILADSSSHNIISDNVIRNNIYGVNLISSNNNMIFNNNLENCTVGIGVSNCTENLVYDNIVSNGEYGITLVSSQRNRLYNNSMTGNLYNFQMNLWGLGDLSRSDFNNSIEMSNLVDGKHICYLQDAKDIVVNPELNVGIIYAIGSENITVRDLNLSKNGIGVYLWDTRDSTIENVTVSGDERAVDLTLCMNVTVRNCTFVNYDVGDGIYVNSSSMCNIARNEIRYNSGFGIEMENSSNINIERNIIARALWQNPLDGIKIVNGGNNSIFGNSITGISNNVFLYFSSGNRLYHNNFDGNLSMFLWNATQNIWDNGLEGNYWTDYNGTDANQDGIGDTEYILLDGSIDHHPLMGKFYSFKTDLDYDVDVISNSTIEKFGYSKSSNTINLQVTNMVENQTDCFSRITIPTALMNKSYHIYVNGTEKPFNLLPSSNTTYSYLYCTYDLKVNVTYTNASLFVNLGPDPGVFYGITIRLYDDVPITTANFINLTKMGIYDNTIFYRVINNSIVQGGDPTGTGYGDPRIAPIQDELPNRHSNTRGTIAMAKNLGSNSTTSLFYINLANNTSLDDEYVVFGEVLYGMDAVRQDRQRHR